MLASALAFWPSGALWVSKNPKKAVIGFGIATLYITQEKLTVKQVIAVVLSALFGVGCATSSYAFGRKHITPDTNTDSSLVDGDATSLIEGCGQQPSPLGAFCRMEEGQVLDARALAFIGPPAQCDREACVYIKVWDPQGKLLWGDSIKKGQTRVSVKWPVLLGRDTVQAGDRGLYNWNTDVYWKDVDGKEHLTRSQGDLLLRVFKKGYLPLDQVRSDANFAWVWTEGGYIYKVTTGLRAFVGRAR